MKNHKIKKLFVSIFVTFFVTGLSVTAVTGNLSKFSKKALFPGKDKITFKNDGPLQLTSSLSNRFYYDNQYVYLNLDVKADKTEPNRERSPLNISVVIDRSGSMSDRNKLEYVKKSVNYIIDELSEDDYISVVTYDDYVDILQSSGRLKNKYELQQKISDLKPGGFTNLSDGMFEGYDQVDKTYRRGYINRVFLLSDGIANRGITDRFRLADLVRDRNKRDGITISTFGVGNDFNEDLMTDIAEYGKGNYYYIRNSSDIPEIFASEMDGIRHLTAHESKIHINYPKSYLRIDKVFGYPYEIDGDEIVIDFKDVFSGSNRSVMLKFEIVNKIQSPISFETVLSYQDVNSDYRSITEKQTCTLESAATLSDFEKGYDETVRQNAAMFEANSIMEEAMRDADNGNYDLAKTKIQSGKNYMDEQMGQFAPSEEMKMQYDNLESYSKDLESANDKTEDEKKEMQKSGKYNNYKLRKKNQ